MNSPTGRSEIPREEQGYFRATHVLYLVMNKISICYLQAVLTGMNGTQKGKHSSGKKCKCEGVASIRLARNESVRGDRGNNRERAQEVGRDWESESWI